MNRMYYFNTNEPYQYDQKNNKINLNKKEFDEEQDNKKELIISFQLSSRRSINDRNKIIL